MKESDTLFNEFWAFVVATVPNEHEKLKLDSQLHDELDRVGSRDDLLKRYITNKQELAHKALKTTYFRRFFKGETAAICPNLDFYVEYMCDYTHSDYVLWMDDFYKWLAGESIRNDFDCKENALKELVRCESICCDEAIENYLTTKYLS